MVWIDKMTATVEELTKNVDDMSRIMHDTVKAIAMLTGEVERTAACPDRYRGNSR